MPGVARSHPKGPWPLVAASVARKSGPGRETTFHVEPQHLAEAGMLHPNSVPH
jgi:hypothetical protein